jgi:hypothetical protein
VPFLARVVRGSDSALVRTPGPPALTPKAIAPPANSDTITPPQVGDDIAAGAPADVNCRVFAAQALGRIGPAAAGALSDLRDVVASGPPLVRTAAEQAVRLIQGE